MDMICWVLTDLSGSVGRAEIRVGHDPTPEQVTPPRQDGDPESEPPRGGDTGREERSGLLCRGPDRGGVIFCAVLPLLKAQGRALVV